MLAAHVAPPLPDGGLPPQLSIHVPAGQTVFEIVTPPGGLLVRRLAADLAGLGPEVTWIRPPPFEPDPSSLTALLLMALTPSERRTSGGKELIVVVESPTSAQVQFLLGELLAPHSPGTFAPSIVLIVDADCGTCAAAADTVLLAVPSWTARLARGLVAEHARSAVPLRRLCQGAGGLAGLIEAVLRALPQLGGGELARIVAKTRQPAALTEALTRRLLADASADRLAALEMAGHLGYVHARFHSLEPAIAGSAIDPWWVPLTAGWFQMDPAWRATLVAAAARTGIKRSACLSRLVAELVGEGAIHEAIEVCIDAAWHGLAADLLAGEADRLMSSGRYETLSRWLGRLPAEEAQGHPALAALADEWQCASRQVDRTQTSQRSVRAPVPAFPLWRSSSFRRSSRNPAGGHGPLLPAESVSLGGTSDDAVAGSTEPDRASDPSGGTATAALLVKADGRARVEARLLGAFEVHIDGQLVENWRGNRGRMLLAYLLLHRSRPLSRDTLGGVFWPDAPPDVVRNRLHVALYGLRRDLRSLTPHPIVVHGRAGFSLHRDVDLWLDTEAFREAIRAASSAGSGTEAALASYETALELYRGDLLEDAPFEEWALLDREQLRVKHLETLDRTAVMHFELGHYAECIQLCQRLVSGDVCREDIHRQLMRCYARLNQPHLAVHQYHLCERQLRDELGLEPAEPTRELYEQIRRRQLV